MHINFKILVLSILSTILLFSCAIHKSIHNSNELVKKCSCNNTNTEYINSFLLANKKEMIVCATKIQKYARTTYKSVHVINCATSDSIVLAANNEYTLENIKDTLFFTPEYYLPQTINYTYLPTAIFIEKVFVNSSNKLESIFVFNSNFPRYTQSQILDVFESYQLSNNASESTIKLIMDKLLMAALSDNQLAMKTFKNFEAKFKNLSPELKERYNHNKEILKQYLAITSLK